MNKIYSLVWNRARKQVEVASELTRSHGKGGAASGAGRVTGRALAFTALAAASLLAMPAWAGTGTNGGTGPGTAISNCTGSPQATTSTAADVAIGCNAVAQGSPVDGATAIGDQAKAYGNGAVTLGERSVAGVKNGGTNQSVAIGSVVTASGDQATAIGNNAVAQGNSSVAIGGDDVDKVASKTYTATINGTSETKTGAQLFTDLTGSTAIASGRYRSPMAADASVALGPQAMAGANADGSMDANSVFDIAIGTQARSMGFSSVAIGTGAQATGDASFAIGAAASAAHNDSTAFGSGATAGADSSFAFGHLANAAEVGTIAFGANAQATATNTIAFGAGAQATADQAMAFGAGALADGNMAIAIGPNSHATAAHDGTTVDFSTVGGYSGHIAGAIGAAAGVVSFGQDIQYQADPNAPDGIARDANGNPIITDPGVQRQLQNVAPGRISDTSTDAVNGSQLNVTNQQVASNTENLTTILAGDTNPVVYVDAYGTKVRKADDGNWYDASDVNTDGSVVAGATAVDQADVHAAMQSASGSTAAATLLTNVAPGAVNSTSTDAVNGSQLYATNQNVAANTTSIGDINTTLAKGFNVSANGGATTHNFKLGDTVDVAAGTNIVVTQDSTTGGLTIATSDTPTFTSVTTGSGANTTVIDGSGVTVNGGANGPVSLTGTGLDNGGNQITNVADGSADSDAATVGQMNDAVAAAATHDFSVNSADPTTDTNYANGGATGVDALAAGVSASAAGDGATAVGNLAQASGTRSTAVGFAAAAGFSGVAVGNSSTAAGDFSVAVGRAASAGYQSVAMGYNAAANGYTGVALGNSATATNANDVALGAGSSTVAPSTGPYTVNGGTIAATSDTNGVVSVGSVGNERQIQNVAAGTVSAASTDAVNGSQLYAVGNSLNNLGDSVASGLGGTSSYDPTTGAVTTGIDVGGTTYNNVNDAIDAVNTTASAGWSLSANGGTAVNIAPGGTVDVAQGNNIVVTQATDGSLTIATSDTPAFTSVTTTGGITVGGTINANGGITVAGGQTVDMGGNQVTNVASGGTTMSNAANIGDVQKAANAATTEVVAGTNVAGVVKTTDVTDGHGIYTVNADGASVSAGSSAVSVTAGTKDANNVTDYAVDLSQATKDTLDNAVQYDDAGHTSVTLGGAGATAPVVLTNVADGDLSSSSTDAVNGSQLYATNQDVATNTTNIANNTAAIGKGFNVSANGGATTHNFQLGDTVDVAAGNNIVVTQDSSTGGLSIATSDTPVFTSVTTGSGANTVVMDGSGITVNGGTNGPVSLTGAGLDNGGNKITNVAAGSDPDDAVNFSQLGTAIAGATTEVAAGTNVAGVAKTTGADGQSIYTVNADGASVSAGSSAVSVTPGTKDANNVTDYAVDLSQATKDTLDNAVQYDDAGHTSVTLGGAGATAPVVLTNVADGALSDTSTDAVNGSQLYATNQNVAANTTSIGDLNTTVAKGFNVSANGGTAHNFQLGDTVDVAQGNNIVVTQDATTGGLTVALDSALTGLTSIAFAGGGPVISNTGIDMGDTKITNLAAGTDPTDAVNVSQLGTAVDGVKTHYYSVNDGGTAGGNYDNDGATGAYSLAAGVNTTAAGDYATAVGFGAAASGTYATAMGMGATASGYDAIAVGSGALAAYKAAVAMGAYANAGGTYATAIGTAAYSAGNGATSVGGFAHALGDYGTAVGFNAYAAKGGTALGFYSAADMGATSVGMHATAYAGATAIGYGANAAGYASFAGGQAASAAGYAATALGHAANAAGDSAVALGNTSVASGAYATAVGSFAVAQGYSAAALGDNANALGDGSLALGASSIANNANDVALGSGSVTAAANPTASTTIGGTTYNFAGANPQSVVSVGSVGNERQITNVAAGQLSASSTDAVNGSQLYATNQAIDAVGTVANAGWNLSANGGTPVNIAPGATVDVAQGTNIVVTQAADGSLTIATSMTPVFTSVTTGNSTLDNGGLTVNDGAHNTSYGADGMRVTNGPSVTSGGIDAGNQKITNVAAGTSASDAVNVGQLTSATGNLQTQIDNINQGGSGMFQSSADSTGSPSATGQNSAAGGANAAASGNDSVAVGNDSTASGGQSTAIGTSSTASGTGSTALGDGASATGDNSVAIGAGSVASGDNTVSVGSAGNERQITNVAAGSAPTDAVNVSQLQQAQKGGVQYDTNSDGTTDYNSVTMNPGGTGPTVIHNVGAGVNSTDAVNLGQLNTSIAGAVTQANNYTDQKFGQLQGQLGQIGNRANAGIASAIAAASLPQPYAPNQSSLGVGMGSFRGEAGIAVGLSKISESGRWILKANVNSDTRGDVGAGVGAGIVW